MNIKFVTIPYAGHHTVNLYTLNFASKVFCNVTYSFDA